MQTIEKRIKTYLGFHLMKVNFTEYNFRVLEALGILMVHFKNPNPF